MLANIIAFVTFALVSLTAVNSSFNEGQVGQGDCTGVQVYLGSGIDCYGNCTITQPSDGAEPRTPPPCAPKTWTGADQNEYSYCGCEGINEPSCCHLRGKKPKGSNLWVGIAHGVCTTCPLPGSCSYNTTNGQAECK